MRINYIYIFTDTVGFFVHIKQSKMRHNLQELFLQCYYYSYCKLTLMFFLQKKKTKLNFDINYK